MQSPNLRRRPRKASSSITPMQDLNCIQPTEGSEEDRQPPKYTIDLSLPPGQRYQAVARAFLSRVETLPILFDEVIQQARLSPRLTRLAARLCLRRIHNAEETEELRGISQVTGIQMYLLVAFNVLLDLFMGCTSGGVKVRDSADEGPRMLHFRTLDWGMDPLRKVIVQLDFVENPHGPVIASSITYVGYVGILTGVKQGLSMSLNFRPCHDQATRMTNFRFYFNHLLVLLGRRPSISSLLRQYLLPPPPSSSHHPTLDTSLASIERHLPGTSTTAAYIIFCDGQHTTIFEKDRATAVTIPSNDFAVATNHDAADEAHPGTDSSPPATSNGNTRTMHLTGMETLVQESIHRKGVLCNLRSKTLRQSHDPRRRRRPTPSSSSSVLHSQAVTTEDVIDWMTTYPITNEGTHFATVMDPTAGTVVWIERYSDPLR